MEPHLKILHTVAETVGRTLDVEEILKKRHGVREVVRRRKADSSRPAPDAILGELSAADAVVSGIGD